MLKQIFTSSGISWLRLEYLQECLNGCSEISNDCLHYLDTAVIIYSILYIIYLYWQPGFPWSFTCKHCNCASLLSHPSLFIHSRFGPRTMAMFPGVILFTSWCSVSLERNLIKYLLEQSTRSLSLDLQSWTDATSRGTEISYYVFSWKQLWLLT